jgi:hypothetical protein
VRFFRIVGHINFTLLRKLSFQEKSVPQAQCMYRKHWHTAEAAAYMPKGKAAPFRQLKRTAIHSVFMNNLG